MQLSAEPQAILIHQLALCIFFAMAVYAALNDAASFKIPNFVSLVMVALFPLHVWTSPVAVAWLHDLAVGALVFASGLVMFARGLMGGGDVKFISAVALWAGPGLILPFLMIMGLAGGVLAISVLLYQSAGRLRVEGPWCLIDAMRAHDLPKIPYGIAIAAGATYVGVQLLTG